MRVRSAFVAMVAWLVAALFAPDASAHAVGVSRGEYAVDGSAVHGRLAFARRELATSFPDLDPNGDGTLDASELALPAVRTALARVFAAIAVSSDGVACPAQLGEVRAIEGDGVAVETIWRCASAPSHVVLTAGLLASLPTGHRHLARFAAGATQADAILYAAHPRFELEVAPSAAAPSVPTLLGFVRMGIEHILTGYDHLLFLVALVLVGGRMRPLLAVVTAFTAAHSLTLAVAALGVWTPSPRLVEPAIALSIAYVGFENFVLRGPSRRWKLTFAFGLVHGFGFAGALREIALPRADVPPALLGFNAGVELGQLAILALALPLLALLRRRARFASIGVPVLSGVIALAGVCWFVVRVFPEG